MIAEPIIPSISSKAEKNAIYVEPVISGTRIKSYVETYLIQVLGEVPKYSSVTVVAKWRTLGVLPIS